MPRYIYIYIYEAMRNAQGFIKAKGLKPGTAITRSLLLAPCCPTCSCLRVIDGGEPAEFKTLFKKWKDLGEITSLR